MLGIGKYVEKITGGLRWQLGMDLGSSNTRIFVKDKGVVIDEPTLVARVRRKRFSKGKNGWLAVGARAAEMWCREPKQIEVVTPIKNGVVVDIESTEKLAGHFLRLIDDIPSRYPKLLKPMVVAGVPSGATEVQKRALSAVLKATGVGQVVTVEGLVLTVVGLGLPMLDGGGVMVVDVGGGKTEVGIISMGGVVVGRSIKTAGDDFDVSIVNYVRMKYGMLIGLSTAARAKMELSCRKDEEVCLIRGRDLATGLPKTIKIKASEVSEAVNMDIAKIIRLVTEVLDESPPELMNDIVKKGIVITGGGGKVRGLAEMMGGEIKISCVVAENPEWCTVRGLGELVSRQQQNDWVNLILKTGLR